MAYPGQRTVKLGFSDTLGQSLRSRPGALVLQGLSREWSISDAVTSAPPPPPRLRVSISVAENLQTETINVSSQKPLQFPWRKKKGE